MHSRTIVLAIAGLAACGGGGSVDPADAGLANADAPGAIDARPDAVACSNVLVGLGGACMSAPVGVTPPSPEVPIAEVAWTDGAFAIVWIDRDGGGTRRIYLTRVDVAGAPLGTTQLSTASADVYNPTVAWSGSELGVAWTDSGKDVWFVRVAADGTPIGVPAAITEPTADAAGVAIAWGGDRWGLVWGDTREGVSKVFFAAISAMGVKLTADVRVSAAPLRSWLPALVWTGTDFAIAYREDSGTFTGRIFLAFVDAMGNGGGIGPISDVVAWVDAPTIAWNGTQLAIVWDDDRVTDRELYAAFFDAGGVEAGPDVRLTASAGYSENASIAWHDGAYRVVWEDDLSTGAQGLLGADIDAAGTKLTPDVDLASTILSPASPRLRWAGDRWGVFWQIAVSIDPAMRQVVYATVTSP
jgi:hypothetical protein